mmetsp:Transcript_31692/g.72804  ORF Transcript_31692/g.72804 Transcript_31692/m.72804 type:complete len:109 (+) Transcript_31692:122-448(+)|eukprot:CAMPEP_0116822264 /NCGR_PEP_ID=MMETSP0418-20121206/173_1 /TAXON_ID=1158023 /ORGANISM="Astrosyne radiata, Strain 13vi08-1A" /LENGTH=108 /DNA_ID=CAMNT_0004450361 /DNA_START=111 /DNA_END=437 /DNA_ORIENTATION=+
MTEDKGEDPIPSEKLEQIRQRFDLSSEQMKVVMERSRKQLEQQKEVGDYLNDATSFYRLLNRLVYVIAFGALVFVLNRDYNHFASFWFGYWFPREARTLGLSVPEPVQ